MKTDTKYHKINSIFKRDMEKPKCPMIMGDYAVPEFKLLENILWVGHEKIDGTNIRIIYTDERVYYKGRTDNAKIPPMLLEYLENRFTLEFFKEHFDTDETVILYGEGCGYKIQNGSGYVDNERRNEFIMFDIKIGSWWLTDDAVTGIGIRTGVKTAPKVCEHTLPNLVNFISSGLKSTYGDFYAEGIVVKPSIQLFNRRGDRIITKIKHKDLFKGGTQ